jgi:hypothetical protein
MPQSLGARRWRDKTRIERSATDLSIPFASHQRNAYGLSPPHKGLDLSLGWKNLMSEINRVTILLMVVALVVFGAALITLLVVVGAQQSHIDSLYDHVNFLRSYDNALLTELHSLLVHAGIGGSA